MAIQSKLLTNPNLSFSESDFDHPRLFALPTAIRKAKQRKTKRSAKDKQQAPSKSNRRASVTKKTTKGKSATKKTITKPGNKAGKKKTAVKQRKAGQQQQQQCKDNRCDTRTCFTRSRKVRVPPVGQGVQITIDDAI